MREGKPRAEGCLAGSPTLLGVQRFSTQPLCLSGEAKCPFHGNLAGSGTAGPGKLSRAALLVLGEHQTGFSANQECRKLLSWASRHGVSPPGEWMKPWAEIAFWFTHVSPFQYGVCRRKPDRCRLTLSPWSPCRVAARRRQALHPTILEPACCGTSVCLHESHQGAPTAAWAPLSVLGDSACLQTTVRSGRALAGLMRLPQSYFRKVFIRAGALVTATAKAAKVFPLCYISLFSLACNYPKVSPRRLKFSRPPL